VEALTTDEVRALTTDQVVLLKAAQFVALTSTQLSALTSAQVAVIEAPDATAIGSADIASLTEISSLATASVIAALDESFFLVRFDRLTPTEKKYLRAMAELGQGPHRSGDIAAQLKRDVTSLAPTRGQLIRKGMIWSPNHGDTAFTVPLFDQFMHRIMPGDDWRN
jgi:hypothetical protein